MPMIPNHVLTVGVRDEGRPNPNPNPNPDWTVGVRDEGRPGRRGGARDAASLSDI